MCGLRSRGCLEQWIQIHMLFEGIGQAVEQGIPLATVVWLLFAEVRESSSAPKAIQPAPAPGAVIEDSMQIGA